MLSCYFVLHPIAEDQPINISNLNYHCSLQTGLPISSLSPFNPPSHIEAEENLIKCKSEHVHHCLKLRVSSCASVGTRLCDWQHPCWSAPDCFHWWAFQTPKCRQGASIHAPQVCRFPVLACAPYHLLPELWLASHHLTLFSFLAQALFYLSIKVQFVLFLQEVIFDPLVALKDFYSYLPTYLPRLITRKAFK